MLKYKKKRIVKYITAVIVPVLLITITVYALNYYQKIDIKEINVISDSKKLFSSKDSSTKNSDKKSAELISKEELSANMSHPDEEEENLEGDSSQVISDFEGNADAIYTPVDTNDVLKDKLIAKKTYIIPVNKREVAIDSLLMNRSSSEKQMTFTVEFWVSPIGFRGYKKSKTKAIIFGITDIDNTELYIEDSEFYLITNNKLFLLEPNNEFVKLTQVIK